MIDETSDMVPTENIQPPTVILKTTRNILKSTKTLISTMSAKIFAAVSGPYEKYTLPVLELYVKV